MQWSIIYVFLRTYREADWLPVAGNEDKWANRSNWMPIEKFSGGETIRNKWSVFNEHSKFFESELRA